MVVQVMRDVHIFHLTITLERFVDVMFSQEALSHLT